MKRKVLGVALAFAISTAAIPVYADGIAQSLIHVDGRAVQVRTAEVHGLTGYAIRDLAQSVGATITWDAQQQAVTVTKGSNAVVFKAGSEVAMVNGQEVAVAVAPSILQGAMFVDVTTLMEALACDVAENGNDISISTVKLIEGASSPQWLFANRILVSTAGDEGVEYYVVDNTSKMFKRLIEGKANAVDVAVSKDGGKVAYSDDKGAVYVVDIFTGEVKEISKDSSIKSELQWSPKGDMIYYIAGEKSNAIAVMNVADGKVTTVFDDKVNYKSDLKVNAEGTKALFAVTKEGKFSDVNGTLTVDTTGTEPQLYTANLGYKDAKAVQLTKDKDNKSSICLLGDGQAIYIGIDMENENSGFDLKIVSADGKTQKKLVEDLNVMHVQVLRDDRVFALGTNASGEKAIYAVSPSTGAKAVITKVDASVVDFSYSKDGSQLFVMVSTETGDGIALLENGKMTYFAK